MMNFPPSCFLWPYGKLPTGNAIQELLAEGNLADLIGEDDILPPTAYERIAEFLSHSVMSQPREIPV